MLLIVVAYLGGVLTIFSPCVLPVLPFVFARCDRPFRETGLPLLLAMALTFAVVGTLAAFGGGWAVHANQWGRYLAMGLLALFGAMLVFPAVSQRITQPLVAYGNRLSMRAGAKGGFGSSFVLGIATGLLWAPCAGPILGLILATAALSGASLHTAVLLLAYAAGAATSLAAALLVGGRVLGYLKRSLGAGEWIRRGLGVAVLAGVALIATGIDRGLLTQVSLAGTAGLEQALLERAGVGAGGLRPGPGAREDHEQARPVGIARADAPDALTLLPVQGRFPSLAGATQWLNSEPLTTRGLRGKVVLIDFRTYSCIRCLRARPHVQAWAERYADDGLVVIGVHSPELAFEHGVGNVRAAVAQLGISHPVAIDNDSGVRSAFDNRHWPAQYLIDAQGRIRYHHFGEGGYARTELAIRALLGAAARAP